MTNFVSKSKETDFAFVTTGLFKELISKKLLRRDFSLLKWKATFLIKTLRTYEKKNPIIRALKI